MDNKENKAGKYGAKTRPFRFLAFVTYLPIPMMGIMIVFGLLGKIMQVGWLESAPSVLMIPMLLAYYVSLIMGAIYGYLKKEDNVYLMAMVGIGLWVVGSLIGALVSAPRVIMFTITIIFLIALFVLHIMQYMATKKWDERLLRKGAQG